MPRHITFSLCTLALLLALATVLASSFGALRLPVNLLWREGDDVLRQIWLTIRLPRVLLALVIGGSLALAGCVMQGLFPQSSGRPRPARDQQWRGSRRCAVGGAAVHLVSAADALRPDAGGVHWSISGDDRYFSSQPTASWLAFTPPARRHRYQRLVRCGGGRSVVAQ